MYVDFDNWHSTVFALRSVNTMCSAHLEWNETFYFMGRTTCNVCFFLYEICTRSEEHTLLEVEQCMKYFLCTVVLWGAVTMLCLTVSNFSDLELDYYHAHISCHYMGRYIYRMHLEHLQLKRDSTRCYTSRVTGVLKSFFSQAKALLIFWCTFVYGMVWFVLFNDTWSQ